MNAILKICSILALTGGLVLAARADEPSAGSERQHGNSHHGIMGMMGMGAMMAECERMMQTSGQHQTAPNQQWRQDRQQPESR